ncbi:MAG: spermidine synthase [Planctomycetaceae bacterium]
MTAVLASLILVRKASGVPVQQPVLQVIQFNGQALVEPLPRNTFESAGGRMLWFCSWLLAGCTLTGFNQVTACLWPQTWELRIGPIAGLCLGAALSLAVTDRRSSRVLSWLPACVMALGLALMLRCFPQVIHAVLTGNLTISDPGLQMQQRFVGSMVLGGVLAFVSGLTGNPILSQGPGKSFRRILTGSTSTFPGAVIALVVGAEISHWGWPMLGGPDRLVRIAAIGWCGLSCCNWLVFAKTVPELDSQAKFVRLASAAGLVITMIGCGIGGSRYQPALAHRLLFSSSTLAAHRQGLDFSLLPYLDEARLVDQSTGSSGVSTAWRYAAQQWQIRANGIPQGVLSEDPSVFPRHATDTLQAVLPLVLHPHPRNVLILGVGSGETLDVALTFPLEGIVCSEPDHGLQMLIQKLVEKTPRLAFWTDSKLRHWTEGPTWALARHPGSCDIILSLGDSPALIRDQPSFTREFYQSVASRLATDGIFCQRWQGLDFGPEALAVWVNTIRAEFKDVLLIESAPGEYLCCATPSAGGLLRGRWARRLQLPHVRKRLAESGLDWSVVLNLPVVSDKGLAQLTAGLHGVVNSAASSLWPYAMPREMWRPASKIDETHATLSPVAQRLLASHDDEPAHPELLRRLSETEVQQQLMTRYSSQFWAYRKFLREQVEQRPRSQIQVATLDEKRKLHPEDARRLGYFEVLGAAVRTKSPEDIERLASFATPYDPLISYFVHQECAELYRHSATSSPAEELNHRLQSIWFGAVRDASLRNVLRAMEIAASEELDTLSTRDRFDIQNALIQALVRRWEERATVAPSTARELVQEADQTLKAVLLASERLAELSSQAGVTGEEWNRRREVIDRTLVRNVEALKSRWLSRAISPNRTSAEESLQLNAPQAN